MNEVVFNKISSICTRKEMCINDVLSYLSKYKNISDSEKDEIIKALSKDNFIDEERYAKAFVNDAYKYNKWGIIKIRTALKAKKIPDIFIETAINTIDKGLYESIKQELAEKKRKSLKKDDPYIDIKVKRYLYSKGFN